MKNYKQLILATLLMVGTATVSVCVANSNAKATIQNEITKYHLNQELKSVYSEYNMLMKNKAHGAKIPQSRLDNLQEKARVLRVAIQER